MRRGTVPSFTYYETPCWQSTPPYTVRHQEVKTDKGDGRHGLPEGQSLTVQIRIFGLTWVQMMAQIGADRALISLYRGGAALRTLRIGDDPSVFPRTRKVGR